MLAPYHDPLAAWKFTFPSWVQSHFEAAGFTKLESHAHEIVFFCALYSAVYVLSGLVTPFILPQYNKLTIRNRINFDMHVTSHVQAIVLVALTFPLYFAPELHSLTSYTPYAGLVGASAVGYFIWDLYVSFKYLTMFGWPFLAHAITALFTIFQSFRPYLFNYAAPFLMYEASTPFVNVHWFATHVPGMIPESLHTINGLILILVFFVVRVVGGTYNGYFFLVDTVNHRPQEVPIWAAYGVLASYLTLSALNIVWFSKMMSIALQSKRKRD